MVSIELIDKFTIDTSCLNPGVGQKTNYTPTQSPQPMLHDKRLPYTYTPWLFAVCLILLFILACAGKADAQGENAQLNLDFENLVETGNPQHWYAIGSPYYRVYVDSNIVQSGRYALRVESDDQALKKFKTLIHILPLNYKGKEITLSAYIKTENVQDGFVSPMIRLDPGVDYEVQIWIWKWLLDGTS